MINIKLNKVPEIKDVCELIVDNFLEPALAHDDGDVDTLVFGAGLDLDVDAGTVLLGDDIDIGSGVAHGGLAVSTDIESTFGHGVQVGDLLEQPLLYLIYFFDLQHVFLSNL